MKKITQSRNHFGTRVVMASWNTHLELNLCWLSMNIYSHTICFPIDSVDEKVTRWKPLFFEWEVTSTLLFTYYLRTVRTPTKLVATLALTLLLETCLLHYSNLGYLITWAQVGVPSHGTQLTPSALTQASDQQHTTQLSSPHVLHNTCFTCVYV